MVQQQSEAQEAKRRQENTEKAKSLADELFPDEKWISVEDGIYRSPRRATGKNSHYQEELEDAQILHSLGSTVYLVSEPNTGGKKFDAIVDDQIFEFKNITGGKSSLLHRFFESREQAPNVFINLDESNLTRREIMSTLHWARNKPSEPNSPGYIDFNKFQGGAIILKIKGMDNLVYLDVDDLKKPM